MWPLLALTDLSWTEQLGGLGIVALAAVLGGLLGLQRSFADKPAGLRTHMLVAAAAAALVWGGAQVLDATEGGAGDPNRALHAIITGIGFLGAGTILRLPRHQAVVGLTTAASLLFAAAIGVVVGSGLFVLGVGLAALGALVLHVLVRFDPHDPPPTPEVDDAGDEGEPNVARDTAARVGRGG